MTVKTQDLACVAVETFRPSLLGSASPCSACIALEAELLRTCEALLLVLCSDAVQLSDHASWLLCRVEPSCGAFSRVRVRLLLLSLRPFL